MEVQSSFIQAMTVAIVGSGPSGCYTAQFLRKELPLADITVFERLPVPYGLVRYGVAGDHQGTKNVTRQFDRMFDRERVRFAGNVALGKTVSLADLRECFDITILATGLSGDRALMIPGAELAGIYGAGRMTRLLNAHPDEARFEPVLGRRVVIVGNGNVAIDLVRLLSKGPEHLDGTDVSHMHGHLYVPHRHIDVVGRTAAAVAKFDTALIRELGRTPGVRYRILGALEPRDNRPIDEAKLTALLELERSSEHATERTVDFHFGWAPVAVLGTSQVEAVHFQSSDEGRRNMVLPAESVITAIGFCPHPEQELLSDAFVGQHTELETGRVPSDLYSVGWLRRGPRGGIPDNRDDARTIVGAVTAAVRSGSLSFGKPGFCALPSSIKEAAINFEGWKRIDRAELDSTPPERLRAKISSIDEMLTIARSVNHANDAPGLKDEGVIG